LCYIAIDIDVCWARHLDKRHIIGVYLGSRARLATWGEGGAALNLLYRRDMVELYLEDIPLVLYLLPRCTGNLKPVHMAHTGDSTRRWAFSGSQKAAPVVSSLGLFGSWGGGKAPLGLGQGPPICVYSADLT
jgi:hypothetical protein